MSLMQSMPLLASALLIAGQADAGAVSRDTLAALNERYRALIEAENKHDLEAVRSFLWKSPKAIFVAKTATPAEGGWAGFWGTDTVLQCDSPRRAGHLAEEPGAMSAQVGG